MSRVFKQESEEVKEYVNLVFQESKKGKIICEHDEGLLRNGLREHLDQQIVQESGRMS